MLLTSQKKGIKAMNQIEIKACFDGVCSPNPGGEASYSALIRKDGEVIWQSAGAVIPLTITSNRLAEYAAYFAVITELDRLGWKDLAISLSGDSKLVIGQMRGQIKIENGIYSPLAHKAKALTQSFSK